MTETYLKRHRRNLREMSDRMFIAALRMAENPMDEDLLQQLCLEAADRLDEILKGRKE